MLITTELLRMWQHCPVQASWCHRRDILPVSLLAHRCAVEAVAKAVPTEKTPYFKAESLAHLFDLAWTKSQRRTQMMSFGDFLEYGRKHVDRLGELAELLNEMIGSGWRVVAGGYFVEAPLSQLLDAVDTVSIPPAPQGIRLSHMIDVVMRNPAGVLNFVMLHTGRIANYEDVRCARRSTICILNNLVATRCFDEPVESRVLCALQRKSVSIEMSSRARRQACVLVANIARGILSRSIPHTEISELHCSGCPVKDLCDDPVEYHRLSTMEEE